MGNFVLKEGQQVRCLFFDMVFPILVRWDLYIETGPTLHTMVLNTHTSLLLNSMIILLSDNLVFVHFSSKKFQNFVCKPRQQTIVRASVVSDVSRCPLYNMDFQVFER